MSHINIDFVVIDTRYLLLWPKVTKVFPNLPCFILLSVLDSFSKITKFRNIVIFTKISSTDMQNSHKEENRYTKFINENETIETTETIPVF